MKLILYIVFFSSLVFLTSCGTQKTNQKALDTYSGSIDDILRRSGTPLKGDKGMRDASTRLSTGGGLFGKEGINNETLFNQGGSTSKSVGLPINAVLWRSSLDVIEFMPIASADPFAGMIITDWYTTQKNTEERCKLNIFIKGVELRSDNLKVNIFCQNIINQNWVDIPRNNASERKIENAILNKTKKNLKKNN